MVRLVSEVDLQKRFLLWDWVKLLSFVAIVIFHFQWTVWYTYEVPDFLLDFWLTRNLRIPTEFYARALSFSGFTIVFLAGLNQGQTAKPIAQRLNLFIFLFLGWFVFSLLIFGFEDLVFAWDVYPLLFLGLISSIFFQGRSLLISRILSITGFVMLWIPFWNFEPYLNQAFLWQQILVGNCKMDFADWPLFPWVGLIWLGYGIGREWRVRVKDSESKGQFNLRPIEAGLWVILLSASLFHWGAFYRVPLGDSFACHVFRFPPVVFWSHFIWPLFLFRCGIDSRVQNYLARFKLNRWISGLSIVKNFWLAYLVHFAFIHLLSFIYTLVPTEPKSTLALTIGITYAPLIPTIEYLTRGCEKLIALVANKVKNRK